MTVLLRPPTQDWWCPNCSLTTASSPLPIGAGQGQARFHYCAGLRELWAPMLPVGVKAKIEARDREDYVGTDSIPQVDIDGRPVMSIVTTRDDGQDTVVLVPTALMSAEAMQ